MYIGDTIEYDLKSYQVRTTIVKYIKVRMKILNFNFSHNKIKNGCTQNTVKEKVIHPSKPYL